MPELITVEELLNMGLPPIIIYAAPVLFALVFIEWGISAWQNKDRYEAKDFWASTGIGVGNIIVSSVTKISIFGLILFFYNIMPWRIPYTWWSFPLCFIFLDFCRYWAHRIAHEQRIWWATHVPHHSSEQYNFSVSFRLSWVQGFKVLFFLPVAMAGFHPVVFFICHQIAVLYQFWIHTEMIDKLWRPIEFIFTTPSHHRVHHAKDDHYLDKNYGSTLIIWDRMFGTFQPELNTPNYGITKPPDSYNPIYLVFHEFIDIWKDLKKASGLREYLWILFASPAEQARAVKEDVESMEQEEVVTTEPVPVEE